MWLAATRAAPNPFSPAPYPSPVAVPDDMHRHVHSAAFWCLEAPDVMWPRWPQRYATSSARRGDLDTPDRMQPRRSQGGRSVLLGALAHPCVVPMLTWACWRPLTYATTLCVVRHTYFFIYFIKLLPNCHKKLRCQNYFVPR